MNGKLGGSSKMKRMSSLVVHACSPMDREFKDSLSYTRSFIKKREAEGGMSILSSFHPGVDRTDCPQAPSTFPQEGRNP